MLWVLIRIASADSEVVVPSFVPVYATCADMILMSTHYICFSGEIKKIILKYPPCLFLRENILIADTNEVLKRTKKYHMELLLFSTSLVHMR